MKNKKIAISIDTSGRRLGLALHAFTPDGKVSRIMVRNRLMPGKQSEFLIPTIDRMLTSARIKKEKLSLIVCNIGPGSFTGVRMGTATARALGQSLKIPVVGISGLHVMAKETARFGAPGVFISFIPALAGEIYFSVFQSLGPEKGLKCLLEPRWRSVAEARVDLRVYKKHSPFGFGENIQKIKSELGSSLNIQWKNRPGFPSPDALGRLGIEKFLRERNSFRFDRIRPLYLQPSWAERTKNGA